GWEEPQATRTGHSRPIRLIVRMRLYSVHMPSVLSGGSPLTYVILASVSSSKLAGEKGFLGKANLPQPAPFPNRWLDSTLAECMDRDTTCAGGHNYKTWFKENRPWRSLI